MLGKMIDWHISRSFNGTHIEDECPCIKAKCGMVAVINDDCNQHAWNANKTIRRSHRASLCPGVKS